MRCETVHMLQQRLSHFRAAFKDARQLSGGQLQENAVRLRLCPLAAFNKTFPHLRILPHLQGSQWVQSWKMENNNILTGGLRPTCFMMRRDRMFMTKPPSRGYMVRDWMTVRMSSIGRGFWSISCCITTAKTSDVYTFFSPKQRLVAGVTNRIVINKNHWTLFITTIIWQCQVWFYCTKYTKDQNRISYIMNL